MERTPYPTDLTDEQWSLLEPHLPSAKPGGRPRSVDLRDVVDALLYMAQAGCAWRMLPHDFPPWRTVYDYFKTWGDNGTLEWIHARLREQVRTELEHPEDPSIAVIDSQSVKISSQPGERGFDAGKKDQRPKAALAG